jgi:transposase-like protein
MQHRTGRREQDQQARARLRMIQLDEQVSRNVPQTCRFFAISRSRFYVWLRRYREGGSRGCKPGPPGPSSGPTSRGTRTTSASPIGGTHGAARSATGKWNAGTGPTSKSSTVNPSLRASKNSSGS